MPSGFPNKVLSLRSQREGTIQTRPRMSAVRVAADAEHEAVHAAPYAGPRYRDLCTAFAGLAPSSGPFFARGNCVWPSRGWPRAADCSLMRRNPPRASRGWPRAAVSSLMRGNRPRASRGWPRAPDCSLMLQKIVRRRRGAPRRPRGRREATAAGPRPTAPGRRPTADGRRRADRRHIPHTHTHTELLEAPGAPDGGPPTARQRRISPFL